MSIKVASSNSGVKIAKIVVKTSNTGQLISDSPVTVHGYPSPTQLSSLTDVDASGAANGAVPVYERYLVVGTGADRPRRWPC